jgi:hypothetical protein
VASRCELVTNRSDRKLLPTLCPDGGMNQNEDTSSKEVIMPLRARVNKMSEGEVRTWVLYIRFSAMSEDRKRRIAENTVLIIY